MKTETKTKTITLKRVELHRVCVPLREPFRISNGVIAEKDAIIVEAQTMDGVTGWGEASPMSGSFYSQDTPESAWNALTDWLVPLALGAGPLSAPHFCERLHRVSGESFAKAGIEGALWDAYAQTVKAPLYELFGARARPIPSGVAIGIYDTLDELIQRVEKYVKQGYQRVKIKIQPGWDVEPVASVRARFPELPLMVDANAAYRLEDIEMFLELDAYGLIMIEQPLARDAHEDTAELQRQLKTPICADESAESLEALEEIIRQGAARIINIKVQRVGGLSEALRMLTRARSAGLRAWVGTMPELGIASAQGLHLAALEDFNYPTDIEASSRWYVDDVIEPLINIDAQGFIHLPQGPATGYQVSREKLEQYTVTSKKFTA